MVEYKIEYTDKADRLAKIEYQEKTLKRQMTHDDFTPTGGLMTFIDPLPPTAEQLADEAEAEAIKSLIDGLPITDKLKKIGLYLRKKGYLP